jgi:hypothetical protein
VRLSDAPFVHIVWAVVMLFLPVLFVVASLYELASIVRQRFRPTS